MILLENTYLSNCEQETFNIAKNLLPYLPHNPVIALYGDLGSGKTTLVKGLYHHLMTKDASIVNSPTFNYLNIYDDKIYHFDLYRLKTIDQFLSMGFDEHFTKDNICIIEWPEIIDSILPKQHLNITLTNLGHNKRQIEVR